MMLMALVSLQNTFVSAQSWREGVSKMAVNGERASLLFRKYAPSG
jgi:hypothetical protein